MLIDLQKFITEERPFWSELEGLLDKLEKRPELRLAQVGDYGLIS